MLASQFIGFLIISLGIFGEKAYSSNPETAMQCYRREYTYKALQRDENGQVCWDLVTAVSCWGRCDSGEIGDWIFPFKRPMHPVCVHDGRIARSVILQNCEPGTDASAAEYEYYDAVSCSCLLCGSSTTWCKEIPVTQSDHMSKHIFTSPLNKKESPYYN